MSADVFSYLVSVCPVFTPRSPSTAPAVAERFNTPFGKMLVFSLSIYPASPPTATTSQHRHPSPPQHPPLPLPLRHFPPRYQPPYKEHQVVFIGQCRRVGSVPPSQSPLALKIRLLFRDTVDRSEAKEEEGVSRPTAFFIWF